MISPGQLVQVWFLRCGKCGNGRLVYAKDEAEASSCLFRSGWSNSHWTWFCPKCPAEKPAVEG